MKRILSVLMLMFISAGIFNLYSQDESTEFIFTAFPSMPEIGDRQVHIQLLTEYGGEVRVEVIGTDIVKTGNVQPKVPMVISLDAADAIPFFPIDEDYTVPPSQIYKRAIRVSADFPVMAQVFTDFPSNGEAFIPLSTKYLGKNHLVSHLPAPANDTLKPAFVAVTSAFDDSQVTFRVGGKFDTYIEMDNGLVVEYNETVKYTLAKGDVLYMVAKGPEADLTGSTILSSKPVAVQAGNFCASLSDNGDCDLLTEQLLPMNTFGDTYFVPFFPGSNLSRELHLFPKVPNTSLFKNGNLLQKLNKVGGLGGYHKIPNSQMENSPITITGDRQISAVLYASDNKTGVDFRGAGQLQLVPVEQFKKEISFADNEYYDTKQLYIIYKSDNPNEIPEDVQFINHADPNKIWKSLNQIVQPVDSFPSENYPGYYFTIIPINNNLSMDFRSENPMMGYVFGNASGKFSASAALFQEWEDLSAYDTIPPVVEFYCEGGKLKGTVTDEHDSSSKLGVVRMDPTNSYNFEFYYEEFIIGEDPETDWWLEVLDTTLPAQAHLVFRDRSGNSLDTTVIYYPDNFTSTPPEADFGVLVKGSESEEISLEIENLDENPLIIEDLFFEDADAPFSIVNDFNFPIEIDSGQKFTLDIAINTENAGNFETNLILALPICRERTIPVRAVIQPDGLLFMDNNLGRVLYHEEYVTEMIVSNNSDTERTLVSIEHTNEQNNNVLDSMGNIIGRILEMEPPSLPMVMIPGESLEIQMTFIPYKYGEIQIPVTLTFDNGDEITAMLIAFCVPSLDVRPMAANMYFRKHKVYYPRFDTSSVIDYKPAVIDENEMFLYNPTADEVTVQTMAWQNSSEFSIISFKTVKNGDTLQFGQTDAIKKPIPPESYIGSEFLFYPEKAGENYVKEVEAIFDNGSVFNFMLHGVGVTPNPQFEDFDFGEIKQDNIAEGQFAITNKTGNFSAPLTIYGFYSVEQGEINIEEDSFGTKGFRLKESWHSNLEFPVVLDPGEKITPVVEFNAVGTGYREAYLGVITDSEENLQIKISAGILTGVVDKAEGIVLKSIKYSNSVEVEIESELSGSMDYKIYDLNGAAICTGSFELHGGYSSKTINCSVPVSGKYFAEFRIGGKILTGTFTVSK
jgi:hypothetical protein